MDVTCRSFGIPSPKAGEVKGATVAKAFEDGNIDAVNERHARCGGSHPSVV